jgi:Transglutaminase-like superfamily
MDGHPGTAAMKSKTIRRAYQREAFVAIVLARLVVRFVPTARIFFWANRPPRRINRFADNEASWVLWAVESIGAKPWMNALCLPRALATHAMLRRRGIASRLCLGVARQEQVLIAHAWVEIGENKIVSDPEMSRFRRLAEFGRVG